MRKTISYMLLFIILATQLVSCALADPTAVDDNKLQEPTQPIATQEELNQQQEDITLVVWWWGEPEAPGAGEWFKARADAYTAKHPNVTIELVEQNIDTVITAFRAAASAKSGPDIAFLFSGGVYVMEDVWMENIVPISDYVSAEELVTWIDTESKAFDGKIWTMPFYMQSYLMMYNKELFTQAGLDPENPPETIDELITTCEAFNKIGIPAMSTGMRDAFQGGIYFSEMAIHTLPDRNAIQRAAIGEGSFTDPTHAAWWEALDRLVKAGCFNEEANSLDLYSGWEVFGRGEAAMVQANDGYLPVATDLLGEDNVGIMRFPRFDTGPMSESMCKFSQGLGITSWSPNKEAAADFLVSLHELDSVNAFYETTGIPFASTKFDSSLITSEQQKMEFEWFSSRDQLCPEGLLPVQVWETGLLPATQGIFQQTLSPEEAAKMLEETAVNWRNSNPPDLEQWIKWAGPLP